MQKLPTKIEIESVHSPSPSISWAQSPKTTTSAVVILIAMEIAMLIGKSSIHGLCSVAMLNYQRVYRYIQDCWFVSPLKSWYPHWLVGSYYLISILIVSSLYPHTHNHILCPYEIPINSALNRNNQRFSLPVMISFPEYPRSVRISLILEQNLDGKEWRTQSL